MFKVKKITPVGDKSWYLKWIATLVIILGACLNSFDVQPYSQIIMAIGASLWLLVGILWYDRALIVVNSAIMAIYLAGLVMFFTYYA